MWNSAQQLPRERTKRPGPGGLAQGTQDEVTGMSRLQVPPLGDEVPSVRARLVVERQDSPVSAHLTALGGFISDEQSDPVSDELSKVGLIEASHIPLPDDSPVSAHLTALGGLISDEKSDPVSDELTAWDGLMSVEPFSQPTGNEASHIPLPDDVWLDILKFVSVEDLCNVSLVSRYLNMLVPEPVLWKGVCPKRGKLNKEGLSQFLQDCENIIGRFKKLYLGGISGIKLTESDCKVLLNYLNTDSNKITDVDFFSNDLTKVPPNLLAEIMMSLKTASLRMVNMSPKQLLEIFMQIINKESLILTEFSLEGVDLSKCDPDILAQVMSKLGKVNLTDTHLTTEQLVKILNHIKNSETLTLKRLCLNLVDLSQVPADLLSKAVLKLESVELQDSDLSINQCTQVLAGMMTSKTLKKLNMSENYNIINIPQELRQAAQQKMPSLFQKTCAY